MEVFALGRNLAAEDVLSLLEAEFADAEREYEGADVGTEQEEDAEEQEEDVGAEQKISDEEEDNDSSCGEPVEMEASLVDQSEEAKVEELLRESCGCKLGPRGEACSSVVPKEAIVLTRNNCLQMTGKELDLVVTAQINSLRTPATHRSPSTHGQEDIRPRAQMKFFLQGIQVCQKNLPVCPFHF